VAVIKLYDLARMTTATGGTGTITLGSAVSGFLSFAGAGVANGETVRYAIRDGANSEVGTGVYTSAGATLTRGPIKSTNGGVAISLSGTAEVAICGAAENFRQIYLDNGAAGTPSLTFDSDDDTGLYRIGANNIGVAANGAKVLDIATTGLGVTGTLGVSGVASITNTTDASSGAGALVVSGGIYAAKAVYIASSAASTSTSTGALIVASGGAGIGGDLNWTGAAFSTWSPSVTFNAGSGTPTVNSARYKRFGKLIVASVYVTFSGLSGVDYAKIPLPVAAVGATPMACYAMRNGRTPVGCSLNYYVSASEANLFGDAGASLTLDGNYNLTMIYEAA